MGSDSRKGLEAEGHGFGPEAIEVVMRTRIRETIERLWTRNWKRHSGRGSPRASGRSARGYRHGTAAKFKRANCPSPLPAVCPARLPARRPSVTAGPRAAIAFGQEVRSLVRRERSSSNGSRSVVSERRGASSSATLSCASCRSPSVPPSPSWWSSASTECSPTTATRSGEPGFRSGLRHVAAGAMGEVRGSSSGCAYW